MYFTRWPRFYDSAESLQQIKVNSFLWQKLQSRNELYWETRYMAFMNVCELSECSRTINWWLTFYCHVSILKCKHTSLLEGLYLKHQHIQNILNIRVKTGSSLDFLACLPCVHISIRMKYILQIYTLFYIFLHIQPFIAMLNYLGSSVVPTSRNLQAANN